jgi:hypothetical protein
MRRGFHPQVRLVLELAHIQYSADTSRGAGENVLWDVDHRACCLGRKLWIDLDERRTV